MSNETPHADNTFELCLSATSLNFIKNWRIFVNLIIVDTRLLQISSPACTELEVVMMDWLGKMLDLPKEFLASTGGKGGGIIQVKTDSHVLFSRL
jgi:hypothetical protein